MLIVVLGVSLIVGVVATSIMHLFDQQEENIAQQDNILPVDVEQLRHEEQLLNLLISHHKQLLHIEDQCDRLREKESTSNLISRYEEDASLLEVRAVEISEDLHQLWKLRMLSSFEREYDVVLKRFPKLPSFDGLQSQSVYQALKEEIRDYILLVENKKRMIEDCVFHVPAKMYDHGNVRNFVERARVHTSKQLQFLMEKSDALCDHLQYLCDSLHNIQISGDVEWDQSGLKLQVQELSSYLSKPELLFETLGFDDQMREYANEIQSKSSDIRNRFRAHREVEQKLRNRYKEI